jgi:LuxR family quorum sensing-dependent transcriptional regulator
MLRAEDYGLTNGVCFPIHNINGFEAGVSVSGSETSLPKTHIRSLYLASIMAFNTLRKIRSDHSLRIEAISERECEVLTWCALGKTSKEVAYILFVSENTVNVHIKNAMAKLSAKNKTEAVAIAVRKGIISI